MGTKTKIQNETLTRRVDPSRIMQTGMGFFNSKTLLTAVKLDLFSLLGDGSLTGEEIKNKLDLHGRGLYDFLDSLYSMGFLERHGLNEEAEYANSEESALFLDRKKPAYIGGMLVMANNRLYPIWNRLEDGLKTGKPQNEIKTDGVTIFETKYSDIEWMREFVKAMSGIQAGNFITFSKRFDFSGYKTLCDIGGAEGLLSAEVVRNNPHMKCITLDLPVVSIIAGEYIKKNNLQDKIEVVSRDFIVDPFPKADVITMGNILHDWGRKEKNLLIRKAYDALPKGGALVVLESVIDNDRKQNVFGLLMSLNMLLETNEGYDFTAKEFDELTKDAGFTETFIMPLEGPSSAAIAVK